MELAGRGALASAATPVAERHYPVTLLFGGARIDASI